MEKSIPEYNNPLNFKNSTMSEQSNQIEKVHHDHVFTKQANEIVKKIKHNTVDVYESSLELVRKHPVTSLSTAVGIGVILGLIIRRRNK